MRQLAARLSGLLLVCLAGLQHAHGGSVTHGSQSCSQPPVLEAAEQDQQLRFAAIIRAELEDSGSRVALVSRSGTPLGYFGLNYSHAGVSLRHSLNAAWSVRQLYYACDEQIPRIFDQGLPGFVIGSDNPDLGFISIVLLPEPQAALLESAALDDRLALTLLARRYSANAHAFSTLYQNCNQWVMELLAAAWGQLAPSAQLRAEAQAWLAGQGFVPQVFELGFRPLLWLSSTSALLNTDDHPAEDLARLVLRVSMPDAMEAFVNVAAVGARRIEFCRTRSHVLIRRGWTHLPADCQPGPADTVVTLD